MPRAAGVHIVRSARAGKPIRWYIYAWRGKGAPLIRTVEQAKKPLLTAADLAAIAAALQDRSAPDSTVGGLSTRWTASREWKAFAASTREEWFRHLIRLERKFGDIPLTVFGDPRMTAKLVKWRDAMAEENGPRAADETIKVTGLMLRWGVLQGLVASNTAAPVPAIYRAADRQAVIWTAEDCAAFDAVAPQYLVDARRLAEFTGLRRADLCRLEWKHISETHLALTAAKKSRGRRQRVVMPIVPGLRALLDELRKRNRKPGIETVLVGAKGGPLQPRTLTAQFIKYREQANDGAGIIHAAEFDDDADTAKHLHDLRGTFATRLMTIPGAPLTDEQIASVMGWTREKVAAIRRRYVDEAAIVVAIGAHIAKAM